MKQASLFWDSEETYQEWLTHIDLQSKDYIEDLNLQIIFDELDYISVFGSLECSKIFLHPCTQSSTISYRQDILEEIYQNPQLYKILKDFTIAIKDYKKRYRFMSQLKDEVKKKTYYLQMTALILNQMKDYYMKLQSYLHPEGKLRILLEVLESYIISLDNKEARQVLTQYRDKISKEYSSFHLIMNKAEQQKVIGVTIQGIFDDREADFTKTIEENAKYFFSEYDFTVSAYQDVDITSLDKRLQNFVMTILSPELLLETNALYDKYRDLSFNNVIEMADELAFYLTYTNFMKQYEKVGFYFTRPSHSETCKVQGAYDLSLAINQYKQSKNNTIISNDYHFDEKDQIFILTGANQGGKTTYLRSIGIIQSLYQIGVFVPAKEARLTIVNHIHTHFSKEDQTASKVGRFEQELQGIHRLLHCIRNKDMILFNEPFTSTQRSVSIVLLRKLLNEFASMGCIGGVVTHYYEIVKELPSNSFFSLVTKVSRQGEKNKRTFKILPMEPEYNSYARDIALKCGVSYEQLMHLIDTKDGKGE